MKPFDLRKNQSGHYLLQGIIFFKRLVYFISMNNLASLPDFIISFTSAIQQQVPAVEREALSLVETNSFDVRTIEDLLDTLHSLYISGFKVTTHHTLIAHLSTLHPELANRHKEKFERESSE